jgi:hypothetical protein
MRKEQLTKPRVPRKARQTSVPGVRRTERRKAGPVRAGRLSGRNGLSWRRADTDRPMPRERDCFDCLKPIERTLFDPVVSVDGMRVRMAKCANCTDPAWQAKCEIAECEYCHRKFGRIPRPNPRRFCLQICAVFARRAAIRESTGDGQ